MTARSLSKPTSPHRLLAGLFAVFYGLNGLYMLADPAGWYSATPGVTDTGPFNAHFVRDVGVTFLALAFASAIAWTRPAMGGVALIVAAFWPVGHSLVHVWDFAAGRLPMSGLVTDITFVMVPSLIAALLAVWFSAREGLPK